MTFKIDPEFRALLPKQRPEEHERLEKKILKEGVRRGSIVVGVLEGERILVDGHHTHDICIDNEIDLPPATEIIFVSREEMKLWMIENQLSRRNLTDERWAYYIGHEYLATKQQEPFEPLGQNVPPGSRASQNIAEKHGISEKTVRRNAEFAEAVDAIAERDGPEARDEILDGDSGMTKREVIEDAKSFLMCVGCSRKGFPVCSECRGRYLNGEKPKPRPLPAHASRAPDPKPDVLRDDAGRIVPNALVPIFEQREAFRQAKKLCENAGAAMKRLEETDAYRMVDAVLAQNPDNARFVYSTYFRSAASYIGNTIPAHVCPKCKGKIGKCERCGGKGFLTLDELEEPGD